MNISARFEVNIIEIRRKTSARNQFLKTIDQEIAGPATVLEEGDILYIHGTFDQVRRVTKEYGLILLDHQVPEDRQPAGAEQYATAKIGIAEVMLTPGSSLIGKLVEQSGFREKYRVNILASRGRTACCCIT